MIDSGGNGVPPSSTNSRRATRFLGVNRKLEGGALSPPGLLEMHMKRLIVGFLLLVAGFVQASEYVIAVSVDGMGTTYMQRLIDAGQLPHFRQIEADHLDMTVTLPNHTTMLTSRPVKAAGGHMWTSNTDPAAGMTIHSNAGQYIASVFDVARANGRRTGLWSTKTKFSLYAVSYHPDIFCHEKDSASLTTNFLAVMQSQPCQFAFVHFGGTDAAGHATEWGSDLYNTELAMVDDCLGRMMALMTNNPVLKGKTTLIVTADHGGKGNNHADPTEPLDYTIPFLVWGVGATAGDLYAMNPATRRAPGMGRPDYAAKPQPIRNGDLGNLALALLGLPAIPGSRINALQDLRLIPAK